jgi:hypothetical protein
VPDQACLNLSDRGVRAPAVEGLICLRTVVKTSAAYRVPGRSSLPDVTVKRALDQQKSDAQQPRQRTLISAGVSALVRSDSWPFMLRRMDTEGTGASGNRESINA